MDRIDLRVPVIPVTSKVMLGEKGLDSKTMKKRVDVAIKIQKNRFKDYDYNYNSRITPGDIDIHCKLEKDVKIKFIEGVDKLSLSSRGCHSVLKISRTLADLDNSLEIKLEHINEAFNYRRYGDEDYYFN